MLVRRVLQSRRPLPLNRSCVLLWFWQRVIVGIRRFIELRLFERRRFIGIAEGRTQTIAWWSTIRAASRRTARSGSRQLRRTERVGRIVTVDHHTPRLRIRRRATRQARRIFFKRSLPHRVVNAHRSRLRPRESQRIARRSIRRCRRIQRRRSRHRAGCGLRRPRSRIRPLATPLQLRSRIRVRNANRNGQ